MLKLFQPKNKSGFYLRKCFSKFTNIWRNKYDICLICDFFLGDKKVEEHEPESKKIK